MDPQSMLHMSGVYDTAADDENPNATYARLEHRSIRLVRILSNDIPTEVHCAMKSFPLEDAPDYAAVSYTWGAPSNSCFIVLDGTRFPVRTNLRRFLSTVRELPGAWAGWFFLDALSINQHDDEERSLQVQLMPEIYSNALQVLAWLGPCYNGSDQAMFELGRKASYWQIKRNVHRIWNTAPGASIRALCHRPYWSRLWVFQELMLGKQIQLMCGTAMVSWEHFSNFMTEIQSVVPGSRCHDAFEYQMSRASPATTMVQYASMRPRSTTLWDLMFALGHLRCAETRDKIYALLGVAAETDLHIKPDYTVSLQALLNTVLGYQHRLRPPKELEEVQNQCVRLETLLGLREEAMFMIDGQQGLYSGPSEHEIKATPFALPGSPITLWWASFYGHSAVEKLLLASGVFQIDQELVSAVEEGCLCKVEMLFALEITKAGNEVLGVRVDDYKSRGEYQSLSLLGLAIRRKYASIAALLLATGCFDVNAAVHDFELGTPLHVAILQYDVPMVKAILSVGNVEVNISRQGQTPLEAAMTISNEQAVKKQLHCQIVKLLLDSGKVNITVDALRMCRNPDIASLLLDAIAANGDLDQHGTVLRRAIQAGEGTMELVRCALDTFRADADLKGDIADAVALRWALGCSGTLKVLVDSGRFNVNARDDQGRTILIEAVATRNHQVVWMLLKSGRADVNAEDSAKFTALEHALREQDSGLTTMLLASGRIDMRKRGIKVLLDAIFHDNVEVARAVIDSDQVDLGTKPGGGTALHEAAVHGRLGIAKMLLESGRVKSGPGECARLAAIATKNGHNDTASWLRGQQPRNGDVKSNAPTSFSSRAITPIRNHFKNVAPNPFMPLDSLLEEQRNIDALKRQQDISLMEQQQYEQIRSLQPGPWPSPRPIPNFHRKHRDFAFQNHPPGPDNPLMTEYVKGKAT
ncbi:hypothetical protein LTR10_002900 [Elasticomyces elasticus]|nr:hypothetical protein LTR10_002900 [Elasticomyces elasticus]KAK4967760.1 hypothetical protein LTR42_010087 [Elasticomyces elasticus]